MDSGQFKRPNKYSERPRRVRGGVRLDAKGFPERLSPLAQRFLAILAPMGTPEAWVEGMEYASKGQTRQMAIEAGKIVASVQGRRFRAYRTIINTKPLTMEQWDTAIRIMVEQALFSAKLLAGEWPPNTEEVLASVGIELLPTSPSAWRASCDCDDPAEWCKHACAVAYLIAEMIDDDPLLLFTIRGMASDEVLERLRQRREATFGTEDGRPRSGVARRAFPGAEHAAQPLEACIDRFWDAGSEFVLVETPIRRPEVRHPLLRRLGPTPFEEGRFPLVGLLATCYEAISEATLRDAQRSAAAAAETQATLGEQTPETPLSGGQPTHTMPAESANDAVR